MDTQLKKGLIDICVLKTISIKASYGYKIITDVSEYIEISESTLYPVLKRLEQNKMVTTFNEEHHNRIRKYYQITKEGEKRLKTFKQEGKLLNKIIEFIIRGKK